MSKVTRLGEAQTPAAYRADVCIIGAGAAGIYLAMALAERGATVVVVEAGGPRCESSHNMGMDAVFCGDRYPGAQEGRYFGLGGSTSRWGGLLVPHSEADLRSDHSSVATEWNHIVIQVERHASQVLRQLGFLHPPDFYDFPEKKGLTCCGAFRSSGFQVVSGIFLPFRRKNFGWLVEEARSRSLPIEIVLGATMTASGMRPGGDPARLGHIVVCDRAGKTARVEAEAFVVAAGTIESTRILLEIADQHGERTALSRDLGRFLGDHLSIPIADVAPQSAPVVNRDLAPRFDGPWMRNLRFTLRDDTNDLRSFSHFIFANEDPGFRLAKEVLTSWQARRVPRVSASDVWNGCLGGARLAVGRFWDKRLYIPSSTATHLQLDVEQRPDERNAIRLHRERDGYGRRKVELEWRISERDMHDIRSVADSVLHRWSNSTTLPKINPRGLTSSFTKPHDAYHPVGTMRLGFDNDSVVDENLRVRGTENLWVVSTGVLPSAGTANPTFTMLCLAQQLGLSLGC